MDYRKIYAQKKGREARIERICPGIPHSSGIYVFYRDDESGLKMCYVGQAKNLVERCASHLAEYDHIGLSLKKRGFYTDDNPYGWKLTFRRCFEEDLDRKEKAAIKSFAMKGFQLYNVTSGGQGKGKTQIREYKPSKGYHDGILQGKRMLARELSDIISKHLAVTIKEKKRDNKVSIKALEKFNHLLDEEIYKEQKS